MLLSACRADDDVIEDPLVEPVLEQELVVPDVEVDETEAGVQQSESQIIQPVAPEDAAPDLVPADQPADAGVGEPAPAAEQPAVEEVAAPEPTGPLVHEVKPRDTLGAISEYYDVSIEEIRAANGMANDIIYVGDELIIPQPGVETVAEPAPVEEAPAANESDSADTTTDGAPTPVAAPSEEVVHVVQAGETLGLIANSYGYFSWEVAEYNGFSADELIYVGQEILIPAGGDE